MHRRQVDGHVWVDAIKPNTDGGRGWWPDALLDREKPHLSAAVAQPLWIDVVATPSAAAGLHTSARVVATWPSTGDGDGRSSCSVTVKLDLRIYAFTLPPRLHLKTQFFLSTEKIDMVYGGGPYTPMIHQWCLQLMSDFHVNPFQSGSLPLVADLPNKCGTCCPSACCNCSTGTKVDIPALRELIDAGMESYTLPQVWLVDGNQFNESLLQRQVDAQLQPLFIELSTAQWLTLFTLACVLIVRGLQITICNFVVRANAKTNSTFRKN